MWSNAQWDIPFKLEPSCMLGWLQIKADFHKDGFT